MKIENILHFLSQLKENNNREWFTENKKWYDETRAEFEILCKEFIENISRFDEEIKHVEVKECIFRIYRDIRFSHDKTPYKTHFAVFVATDGGRKSQRGGYYLHLDPDGSFVAVGVWCPQPNLLKALRQSIYDNIEEFNEIRNEKNFAKYFNSFLETDKLKNVPKGFPKDFPDAEFLKLKHYITKHQISKGLTDKEDFVQQIAAIAKNAYSLNRFLNYTVDELG